MKARILYIISLFMISLMVVSCTSAHEEAWESNGDSFITLNFTAPGVTTRGDVADNEYESFLSHLDVVVYEYANMVYTPFHYQRVNVSATPNGKVTIAKTKRDFKENVEYRFYVIANSTLDSSAYFNNSGNILDHNTFLKLDQTDNYIHLSGIEFGTPGSIYPQMFLMDGVAYMGNSEPQTAGNIIINNPNTEEDVTIKVTLRRAAAKVQITITPGGKVTLTKELMALSSGYMVRNMPIRTTLTAEGGYPRTYDDTNPYWRSSSISQSPYFEMTQMENITNYQLKLTLYCYSHTWDKEQAFERGTSVVMMLPIIHDGVQYINNYYQISFSKNEGNSGQHLIKRNTYYDLRINLNAPGAEDFNEPEEIRDIKYFTAPWEKVDFEVTGENTVKYLKVNKEKLYMYNVANDDSTLYFSSSSPVTVEFVPGSAYYYNKYSVKTSLSNNAVDIYGSTEKGSTSGNISVHSDIPTNNTIRYFQIKVTNEDGLSEIIDVEQYPLIYITNNLPWYSYRDDYYYRTDGNHGWNGNVNTATTSGDLPTTYEYAGDHIVSIYTINDVNTTTKAVKYTYTSAVPSSNNGGTGWTCSKVRGDKVNNSENYSINFYYFSHSPGWWGSSGTWSMNTSNCENHNVRNYHVRMMASSEDYTLARPALDEHGYTAGDVENSKLVSPSFVIASRLGAVLSTYSNLSNMSNEKKLIVFADHCKNYVEVDDVNDDKKAPVEVYDNWRLPTEAELKIIMDIQGTSGQNADAIDYLLNGGYYMSASGPVYNSKNSDNTTELNDPMQASGVAIRCVRDAY